MTILEAREIAKIHGTQSIKECLELYEVCKEPYNEANIDIGSTYPDGKYFYRWRTHDLAGTNYGPKHYVSELEATVMCVLGLVTFYNDRIGKLYKDHGEFVDFLSNDFENALKSLNNA